MADNILHTLRLLLLAILLGAALYTDLRYGKVYNKLTLPCIILGIAINTWFTGLPGFLQSLGGAALVLALYLLFARIGGIGGGDIKLLMAIGAIMGLAFAVQTILLSAITGGVMALVVMLRHRLLLSSLRGLGGKLIASLTLASPLAFSDPGALKFRYSPAIVVGTLLTMLLKA